MFEIQICGENFEQDIRPLTRAFYPQEELHVTYREEIRSAAEHAENTDMSPEATLQLECTLLPELFLYRLRTRDGVDISNTHTLCWEASSLPDEDTERPQATLHSGDGLAKGYKPEDCLVARRYYKAELMGCLYRLFSEHTGKQLPWGTLTGVRPTKIVFAGLEQGETPEEIAEHMRKDYLCSQEKIAVSLQVAQTEKKMLDSLDYRGGYSIYIGIPFCPTTCYYCSFTSFPLTKYGDCVDPYLDALLHEINAAKDMLPNKELQTIYIGGGTPTTLNIAQLDKLLGAIRTVLPTQNLREMTVEAGRPDTITKEKLQLLKQYDVNRISINPQTMNAATLALIGRNHSPEQIEEAFCLARELGFDNINMDVILGLAGENPDMVHYTLKRLGKLSPEELTVHTLAVKRASRLRTDPTLYAGKEATGVTEMMEIAAEHAMQNGYRPYYLYRQKNMTENLENIGYAKPGFEGLYNVLIMEEKQSIIALGAGGASKYVSADGRKISRVENVKFVSDYIARIDEMIARKQTFFEEEVWGDVYR